MATDDKRYSSGSNLNDSSPPPPPPPKPPGGGGSTGGPAALPYPGFVPKTLDGLGPPGSSPGDVQPIRGRVRWDEELRRVGFTPGTEQYDKWVVGRVTDPLDPEYNTIISQEQNVAKKRMAARAEEAKKIRAVPYLPGMAPPGTPGQSGPNISTGDERNLDVNAKKQAQEWRGVPGVKFVDVNGNIIDPDKTTVGASKPGGQSSSAGDDSDPAEVEEMTDGEFIGAGGAVWVGDQVISPDGTHKVTQGQYRAAGDMMNDVFRWNPAQTAAFQQSIGLDPTGVADEKTVAFWKWVVNTARYYTAMGQHRSVGAIVGQGKSQVSGRGGGRGGGGGGGGGGASVPADAAKRILNQAMKEYAGREATAEELKAFLPAIRGAAGSGDFDATQFAIDWVRGGDNGARSSEVASFQAATDYYAVVQQLIGGR